ncbi:MAG: radical SAM protein, partial [Candidatus Omnitrophota bacterium]
MKVLLINPCFDFKKFGRFQRYTESMPCLGLAYIAAVLEKNAIEVEVIDNFVLRLRKHEVLNLIKAKGPDMVGISCLTPSAPIAFSIAKSIKEYNNKILTVLGNIHADLFSEEILKNQAVDIVVHGEGEYAMLELAKAAENNTDFTYIKGISFKKDGKIVKTNFREPLKDLDRLPYPAWRLFPFKKYGFLPFADVKKPGLSILGSRGCPFRCTFCSLPNIGSNKYRKREPKNIVDEIEYLIANFPIRQIGFVDPIFPISKRDGLEFCDEMISRKLNNKIIWICETRVDKVDRELLREMRKAGCRRIVYGLESGMQASL